LKGLYAPLFEGFVVRTAFKPHCSRDLGVWKSFERPLSLTVQGIWVSDCLQAPPFEGFGCLKNLSFPKSPINLSKWLVKAISGHIVHYKTRENTKFISIVSKIYKRIHGLTS
jgi:hypothetical protein